MSLLIVALRVAGLAFVALAISHIYIARRFRWREESRLLSPFNGQVLLVHGFFIALTVGFMGLLALFWPDALVTPNVLGIPITGGLTVFWTVRCYIQWFVYDTALWRGKSFETTCHILFSLLWVYASLVFGWCFVLQLRS